MTDRTEASDSDGSAWPTGRDRLRELLDAVLAEDHTTLGAMAGGAFSSPYHFSRQLVRGTGEPPVAMHRRVMLERAAWQLRRGASVTDAALAAGYDSVDGFSRAFARAYGSSPSRRPENTWLPAPNGIHFHPPTSLWVHTTEAPVNALTEHLVQHDVDDTESLLDLASRLSDAEYRRVRFPGLHVVCWDGPDESVASTLSNVVWTKEVWVAAIEGADGITPGADDAASLLARHRQVAPRWLAAVRDLDRRDAWDDRMIDALCDPPESFVLASVVAHVLTFAAVRRGLARQLLRAAGLELDDGDPIVWHRARMDVTA
jgi:AraC family transcriptional regulator